MSLPRIDAVEVMIMKWSYLWVLAFGSLLMTVVVPAQTQRYSQSREKVSSADFPLTLQITGSHFSTTERGVLFVDANVEGKKVRLETTVLTRLLHEGDYKARVSASHEQKDGGFSKSYKILFADGSHHQFMVVGSAQ
jgi:hypothetical protein